MGNTASFIKMVKQRLRGDTHKSLRTGIQLLPGLSLASCFLPGDLERDHDQPNSHLLSAKPCTSLRTIVPLLKISGPRSNSPIAAGISAETFSLSLSSSSFSFRC
jgi:hypothetical protein